jgi:hypothetical protein
MIHKIDNFILRAIDGSVAWCWQTFGWTRTLTCRISLALAVGSQMVETALRERFVIGFAFWVASCFWLNYWRVEKLAKKPPEIANAFLLFMREGPFSASLRILFVLTLPPIIWADSNFFAPFFTTANLLIIDALFPMEPRKPREVFAPAPEAV